MNRLLPSCIALLIASSGFGAPSSDVRVLSSTGQGVVIEYIPRYYEPLSVVDGKTVFQHWSFEGAVEGNNANPGNPALYRRSLPLILPGPSGHTVEVLSVEYETLQDVLLQPVAKVEGDFENLRRTYPMSSAYQSNTFSPSNVAEFQNTGTVRGFETGEVRVSPLQYNPASRTLRKYTRMVIRVNFGSPAYRVHAGKEDPLMRGLALNYSTAKTWRAETPTGRIQYRNSVFSSGTWFRFGITESGMYKLTGAALLAAGVPAGTDPRMIKIYSNGGIEPPDDPAVFYPDDVLEIAVYLNDGGTTGSLDNSDYLIFYGESTRGWKYNSALRTFNHTINFYSEVAYYWVTYGGSQSKLMTSAPSLTDPTPFTPTSVVGKVFREDERVNVQNSGRQWLGQSLNHNEALTYLFSLPGLDATQIVRYRLRFGAKDHTGGSDYTITETNNPLITVPLSSSGPPATYSTPYVRMVSVPVEPSIIGSLLQNSQSQLRFSYNSNTGSGIGYIDWAEVFYGRQLVADGNVFNFHSHDTTAVSSYTVGSFTQSPVWVFDVTKFDSVLRITNPIVNGEQCTFQAQLAQGTLREFYMIGDNAFKVPGALQSFPNQDVHGDTMDVDLVVITYRDFMPAAERLRDHRVRPGPDQLSVRIVTVDQVYNEFSGGYLSPVGIRNYLRYLYNSSLVYPKYVLLLGDGDYDYKRISITGPNWIPAWATLESFAGSPLSSYASEDPLVIFPGSSSVQMAVGRLPVRSLQEAHAVVNKIIEYETGIATDPWKLRVTFVADDGREEGSIYTGDSEDIAENYTPPLFEKQKIYSTEYPVVTTSVGVRRPTVNQAIVDAVNRGTLVLNFVGHGNPRLWAHEQVFVREADFPHLTNNGKYFLVIAATCNYSQYDHPFDQSSGEQLIVKPDAGAIASISASRPVYHSPNIALAKSFYTQLFQRDTSNRILNPRLGDAWYKARQLYTGENDRKFLLLGDPSLRFGIPRRNAEVDSLNGLPDSAQFRALDQGSIIAYVRDSVNNLPTTNFNGTALVTVYDADRVVTINKPFEGFSNFTYRANGGVLFRGQSSIVNGRLASTFIVPTDISYDTTRPGRISLFFWSNDEDGAGVTRNLRVGGTNPNAAPDSIGPRISLYLDNRNFRPGALVSDNPLLIADLFDEHGINSSNVGIGHSLEAWVDDQSESIDLSNHYSSKLDSYQEGTIEYVVSGLPPGSHRLRLRAWDTYNNSSMTETNFDVGVSVGLKVRNVFNYPNPFNNATTFTFQHNQLVPVDVEVKIYTVAGRLVESLEQRGVPDIFVKVPWDGRDRDRDEIANGVYLYKIIVRTQDGRFTSETLGKLSKVR